MARKLLRRRDEPLRVRDIGVILEKPAPVVAKPVAPKDGRFIQSVVAEVRKSVRGSTIATLSQSDALADVTEWISSGFAGLDDILGGGWAVGRASEVFGDEGCGKTAIAHRAIKSVQDMGGYAVLLDFEAALDKKKVMQLGIDPERLIYEVPDHIEQGWDIIWAIYRKLKKSPPNVPFLIVWDSIGGAVPRAILEEKSAEKNHVGATARAMSSQCAKMFKRIATVRAHMMWISQERVAVGKFSPFGPVQQTSGGKGPKYAASQRLRCGKVMTIFENKDGQRRAIGYLIKSITKKNRLTAPEQAATWVIDFKYGPSPELSILQVLLDAGKVVTQKGKFVFKPFGKDHPFRRREWVVLMQNEKRRAKAMSAYNEVMAAGGPKAFRGGSGDDEVDSDDD